MAKYQEQISTLEGIKSRIAAIDKMFGEAIGWGSWMAAASSERAGLVATARSKFGAELESNFEMKDGSGRILHD